MRLCGIYLFFFLSVIGFGQFASNWVFGIQQGLKFGQLALPTVMFSSVNTQDNSSCISDEGGNLLFYTDGITVWNRLNQPMPNGTGLIGNASAGQSALIVPAPGHPDKYVIFHVTEFANPGYLCYSVVTMSLDNGLGDVINGKKNLSLGSGWTEKLCAYFSDVNKSYWVLTHRWGSADFVAFKVDSTASISYSVTTTIGSIHNCGMYSGAHDAMGQLTISPNGIWVVNALTCQDKFELFSFNTVTGTLTNSVEIAGSGYKAWGTAFSANSIKLYTTDIFSSRVSQFDLSVYSSAAINSSRSIAGSVNESGYCFGYLELGQDGRVYIARPNKRYLARINQPDSVATASNFDGFAVSLTDDCKWGLSRIAYNIPHAVATRIDKNLDVNGLIVQQHGETFVVNVSSHVEVLIYSITGRLMGVYSLTPGKNIIDVSTFSAATYLLVANEPRMVKRIVKQ